MKKKMIAGIVTAAMLLMPATCYAEATASDVFSKMIEGVNNGKSLTADIELGADFAEEVSEEKIDNSLSVSIGFIKEPAALSLSADLSKLEAGIDTFEAYLSTDGASTLNLYANVMGQWMAFTADLSMLGVEDVNTLVADAKVPENEVKEEEWTVEETDSSFVVTRQVPLSEYPDAADAILQQAQSMGQVDEEMLPIIEKIVDAAVVNMQFDVNKDTYALEKIHMDLNDSDIEALNAIDEGTKIVVNDIYMDITTGFDTLDAIEVPAEALEAEPIDAMQLLAAYMMGQQ
ncbi:MAG: hypothetical protein HUJ72_12055 [Blautia sp.]|nr:hypothetical protein [Blautia sp.]